VNVLDVSNVMPDDDKPTEWTRVYLRDSNNYITVTGAVDQVIKQLNAAVEATIGVTAL
jgi:hypothetical protein